MSVPLEILFKTKMRIVVCGTWECFRGLHRKKASINYVKFTLFRIPHVGQLGPICRIWLSLRYVPRNLARRMSE
jgi:hypothetical protein